jgi:YVTN family beta-propeller protein
MLRLLIFFLTCVFVVASAAQLRQVAIVDIPGRPGFDSVAWAADKLVLAHSGADKVDVFDPVRRRVVAEIPDMKDPRGLAVDAAAGKLYIANAGAASLAVVDTKTWQVVNTIALHDAPEALLLAPGGQLYVAALRAPVIAIVDPARGETGRVDVGGLPEQMAWDPEQNGVFVTLEDQAAVALISDGQVKKRFQLTASQPTGLALDAKQGRLYVAVRYAVLVLNPQTGQEMARIPAAAGVDTLWYDESLGTLYAADTGGAVNMIRTDNNQYLSEHELRTEVRGHALAFDPQKKMIYLPGGREGRSKIVILKRVDNPAGVTNVQDGAPQTGASQQPQDALAGRR